MKFWTNVQIHKIIYLFTNKIGVTIHISLIKLILNSQLIWATLVIFGAVDLLPYKFEVAVVIETFWSCLKYVTKHGH